MNNYHFFKKIILIIFSIMMIHFNVFAENYSLDKGVSFLKRGSWEGPDVFSIYCMYGVVVVFVDNKYAIQLVGKDGLPISCDTEIKNHLILLYKYLQNNMINYIVLLLFLFSILLYI